MLGNRNDDIARRVALARRIWDTAEDARRSPVAHYLPGRGITITPPASLRWAPALRRPDGTKAPATVARIDDVDGALIGMHRTWLDRGAVAIGIAATGDARPGCRRCGAARPGCRELMVAKASKPVSPRCRHGDARMGGASHLRSGRARPAADVRTVIILADHDAIRRRRAGGHAAAARWLAEGRRVRIAMPPEPGTDFNDVLAGRAYRRIEEARCDAA